MCITVGGAKRNLRITHPKKHKPCKGEIMVVLIDNLAPCGAYVFWGHNPAVSLRFTDGYAHHTPCGVKILIAV
ncbi:MAG: hypothetical protein LBU34_17420 [Planctomycetaceae bacterium]|jgi:hypothetical protein|nr:hypothetical protein [Planctomycetaceae bacterium]